MKRQARIFGTVTVALALALVACAKPLYQALHAPIEDGCPQIDHAIDRADTVRWLIQDEGGKLATRSEQRWNSVAYTRHGSLNGADARIRELLQLKRARGCPPRATALPGLDDLALLRELESVQARIDASSGEDAGLLKERTRLLDGLRIVPASAAIPSAGINPAPLKDKKAAGTD